MKLIKNVILITVFLTSVMNFFSWQYIYASVLPTTPKPSDPNNTHLFVGLFYHDIWRNSAGGWTSDGAPGQYKDIEFPYSFDFPGRKIKDIRTNKFEPNMTDPDGVTLYFNSRYKQETWDSRKDNVSPTYTVLNPMNLKGKGTDSASFTVKINGVLDAPLYEDITKHDQGGLIQGRRYYFPILITIELEPDGGEALIRHYTTKGKPLNGIPGFIDRTEVLTVGKSHPFPHTPGTADYVYEGYKVSESGPPSGGSIEQGDPPPLRYNGSFPKYYVYYYYEEVKKPGQPDPIPPTASCTAPSSGRKIEGRHMIRKHRPKYWPISAAANASMFCRGFRHRKACMETSWRAAIWRSIPSFKCRVHVPLRSTWRRHGR